jgi:hypothetical protein
MIGNSTAAQNDFSEKPKGRPTGYFWRIISYSTWLDKFLMFVAAFGSAGAGAALPLMNIIFGKLVGSFNNYFIPGSGRYTNCMRI